MKLFTRNDKIKKSTAYTVSFGLPALKTCPSANICKSFCYATKGAYQFHVVKKAQNTRLELSKKANFPEIAIEQLSAITKLEAVRIHDSGDFYNKEYLYKWIKIANEFPSIHFYAYTKQVRLLKENSLSLPENFTVIYSLGGKEDYLIDMANDRHSRIFQNASELLKAGYINGSHDDTIAINPLNPKIGLVIH